MTDLSKSTDCNFTLTLKAICGKNLDAKDDCGTSDPYLTWKWNKKIMKTKVIDKTLNPVWNETFNLGPFAAADILKFECWDKDILTDDFMGQFVVPLSSFQKEGVYLQWFSLVGRKKSEVVHGEIQLEFTIASGNPEEKKRSNSSAWLKRRGSSKSDMSLKKSSRSKSELGTISTPASPPNPLFGTELEAIAKRFPNIKAPIPIKDAIDHIRKHGLKEEGIFRIGGVKTEIAELRKSIDYGACPSYEAVSNIHNVTGLLKMFLRELPTPLLTYDLYDRWIAAAEIEDEQSQKASIRQLIAELPPMNRNILAELIVLLYQCAQHHEVSFMDANNLSIVVGPNLLWHSSRNLDASFSSLSQVGHLVTTIIANGPEFFPEVASANGIQQGNAADVKGKSSLQDILKTNRRDMVEQARKLFNYVDANGNGTLDREEFVEFFTELMQLLHMPPPSDDDIDEAILVIDQDGNEEIDWDEFLMWWQEAHLRYVTIG